MCLAALGFVSVDRTALGPLEGASALLICLSLSSLESGAHGALMRTGSPQDTLVGPVTSKHLPMGQPAVLPAIPIAAPTDRFASADNTGT